MKSQEQRRANDFLGSCFGDAETPAQEFARRLVEKPGKEAKAWHKNKEDAPPKRRRETKKPNG